MSVYIKEIDKGWKKIVKNLKLIDKSYVSVGVLSDAGSYASGENGINLADVATFNEFGTSRIPARPFMKQSYDKNINALKTFKDKEYAAILDGKQEVSKALDKIGLFFKGVVQKEIASGDFKKNSPRTLALKKSSKPLINTGRLRQSIQFETKLK